MRGLTATDLLERLQSEGQRDSSGKFTLDRRRGAPKLAAYTLPEPAFYMLRLVQSAVTSGATAITVRAGQRGVEMVHDGRLDPELVEWLFHCQSEADCPAAIRSLASGVRCALAVGVRSLSLRCWDGRRGVSQEWQSGGSRVMNWSATGPARLEFRLQRWLRFQLLGGLRALSLDLLDLLSRSRRSMVPEAAAVYDRCPYLGPALTLNGRRVNSFSLGRGRLQVERRVSARNPDSPSSFRAPDDSARPLEAIIGWTAMSGPASVVTWLREGVTVMQEELELGRPGVRALLSSDGLQTDLSGFRLVHDGAYRERLSWLRQQVAEMAVAPEVRRL